MVGLAKSNNFFFGTTGVMLAPLTVDPHTLTEKHSVGLVKNCVVTSDPSYVELKQGIKQSVVASELNDIAVGITFEAYEATHETIAYGLGLLPDLTRRTSELVELAAALIAGSTTLTIKGNHITTYTAGVAVSVQNAFGETFITTVASNATFSTPNTVITLSDAAPVGANFPANTAKAQAVSVVTIGSNEDQPYFGCKLVSMTSAGRVMQCVFPRVRVENGFSLAFATENYGNLPFEIKPFALTPEDPLYADFLATGGGMGRVYGARATTPI